MTSWPEEQDTLPLMHRGIGNLYLLSVQGGGKLPTCGLRAVILLIIIISFSHNGSLIKSDSFVHRRGERGRDKRVPGVFRLRM